MQQEPSGLGRILPPRRAQTLGAQVRDRLREAIMSGGFRPGERLTIRAVAAALGVSLTPAREALFNLAAEGALETAPNGSVFVPELGPEQVRELMVVRQSLEGAAALEAAPHLGDTEIARLRELNEAILEADRGGAYRTLMDLNWQFHFTIYALSHMPYLVKLIEGCWLKTGSYLNVIYPEFGKSSAGIDNHQLMIEAVIRRDAAALCDAIRADVALVSKSLLAAIAASETDP